MKTIMAITLICLFLAPFSSAQQDPAAKEILDRVSEKNKAYSTIQADFELTIQNRRDDFTSSNKGSIKIKGNKYYMESPGTKVYYDGKTQWTYMDDINEVTITEPDSETSDFTENPIIIFDFYNRDFKYRLVGETMLDAGWMYEIDLYPNNLEQPYSRIKVYVKKDTEELYKVSAIGKDGVDYMAVLTNTKYNEALNDSDFTFDTSKHKGVEVVDLRF